MRIFRVLSDRLRALFNSEGVIRDIDEELRLHVQMEFEANLARGRTQEEARAIAAKQFGNYDCVRDQSYEVRGGGMLETLIQDIKYGARVLSGNKAFTLIALFTLALGIGANTAIFSVVYSLLMRPLPYPNANRIVMLWERSPRGRPQNSTSRANFMTWRDESSSFDGMAAFSDQRVNLTGTSEPEELSVQRTSPALFHVLGVEPLLGRTLS